MKIEIEFSDKQIRRIIEGAGSAYWAKDFEWNDSERLGFSITEWADSREGDKRHAVTHYNLNLALAKLMTVSPFQFANIVTENDDMWTGDALIQCAIFGELKYG